MKKQYEAPEAQQILFVSAQSISVTWEEIPNHYGQSPEGAVDVLSGDITITIK